MKTPKWKISGWGFISIVVVFFGIFALVVASNGKRAAEAQQLADNAASQKAADKIQAGTFGGPLGFVHMCGNPDHVRKSNGLLMYVYEGPRVLVSFSKRKGEDEYGHPIYNVFDPGTFAQWQQIAYLQPRDALEKLGCKI